jgi:hypothetical protein
LAEKQKKAEYAKQYRLKRKLLIQQQASTSSEIELVRKQKKVNIYLPSLMMKVPEHVYAYRLYFFTCDMYKSSLRQIHDPVLSSLKMKGIRLLFLLK